MVLVAALDDATQGPVWHARRQTWSPHGRPHVALLTQKGALLGWSCACWLPNMRPCGSQHACDGSGPWWPHNVWGLVSAGAFRREPSDKLELQATLNQPTSWCAPLRASPPPPLQPTAITTTSTASNNTATGQGRDTRQGTKGYVFQGARGPYSSAKRVPGKGRLPSRGLTGSRSAPNLLGSKDVPAKRKNRRNSSAKDHAVSVEKNWSPTIHPAPPPSCTGMHIDPHDAGNEK